MTADERLGLLKRSELIYFTGKKYITYKDEYFNQTA